MYLLPIYPYYLLISCHYDSLLFLILLLRFGARKCYKQIYISFSLKSSVLRALGGAHKVCYNTFVLNKTETKTKDRVVIVSSNISRDVTDIERPTETAVATSAVKGGRIRVGAGPLRAHLQVRLTMDSFFLCNRIIYNLFDLLLIEKKENVVCAKFLSTTPLYYLILYMWANR